MFGLVRMFVVIYKISRTVRVELNKVYIVFRYIRYSPINEVMLSLNKVRD